MKSFVATYAQPVTQRVNAETIEDASAAAKQYAVDHNLTLLSLYANEPPKPSVGIIWLACDDGLAYGDPHEIP
jgi:hypothetical protein